MAGAGLKRVGLVVLQALLVATVVGLVMSVRSAAADRLWGDDVRRSLAYAYSWALLASIIVVCDRHLARRSSHLAAGLLWHVPLGLLVIGCSLYVVPAFSWMLGAPGGSFPLSLDLLGRALRWGVPSQIITYGSILGGYRAFHYHARFRERSLRASELETLLAQSQLQVLRAQLEPHFLFNALNTISAHIEASPRTARQMLEDLGEFLRRSLDHHDQHEVSLSQELEVLGHYLAIQQARFEDRLTIVQEIPDATLGVRVPALLLQPLVENALQHGLAPRAAGGRVAIEAARDGDHLRLRVVDDGVGLRSGSEEHPGDGRGLWITRQRLAHLYPAGEARLEMRDGDECGVTVEITIPWRTESKRATEVAQ